MLNLLVQQQGLDYERITPGTGQALSHGQDIYM